jgi:hypothetical protein
MAPPTRKKLLGSLFLLLLVIAAGSVVYAFFHPFSRSQEPVSPK